MRGVLCTLAAVMLSGCAGEPETLTWFEGGGYTWTGFNHRLSYLKIDLLEDQAEVSVIGGTSTTGVVTDLGAECDPNTCDEFPFFDSSDVTIRWGRAETQVRSGTTETTILATPGGSTANATITFDRPVKGELAAMIQGVTMNTNHGLSEGDACYRPSNGWLPRWIRLVLGEPSKVDRYTVEVPISAVFEAGPTFEEERECLDEVVTEAQVPVDVRILAVATRNDIETHTVEHDLAYEWNGSSTDPTPQPEPVHSDRSIPFGLDPDRSMIGWSAIDFRFHVEEERGAYIRTLSFEASTDGWASGHSSNFSPFTQLSAFDYAFAGEVVAVDLDADAVHEQTETNVDAALDSEGIPVVFAVPLE